MSRRSAFAVGGFPRFQCSSDCALNTSFCPRNRLFRASCTDRNALYCRLHVAPSSVASDVDSANVSKGGKSSVPEGLILLDSLSKGDRLVGKVTSVGGANSLWIDVGVVRRARRGSFRKVNGRLRYERRIVHGKDGKLTSHALVKPLEKEGSSIDVIVKSVDVGAGRFELFRAHRQAPVADRSKKRLENWPIEDGRLLSSLEIGEKLNGEVVKVGSYGVLLNCGIARLGKCGRLCSALGLLRRNRLPREWATEADFVVRDDVERTLRRGDHLCVYVRCALPANGFLRLSATPIDSEMLKSEVRYRRRIYRTKRKLRKNALNKLAEGATTLGVVQNVKEYGAFVDIGVGNSGLLHFRKMGKYRRDWKQRLQRNVSVVVRVDSVGDGRIGLELVRIRDNEDENEEEDIEQLDRDLIVSPVFERWQPTRAIENLQEVKASTEQVEPNLELSIDVTDTSEAVENDESKDDEDDEERGEEEDEDKDELFSDEYFEEKYG